MGKLKLEIEKPKRIKLSQLKKEYTAEELAINYIKVGLSRDRDFLSDEILLTRNGLTKEKVSSNVVKEAMELVIKTIKLTLERIKD